MNTEWMARGKCKEVAPDVFFPSDGMGVLVAQRICAECPVSHECLEYALEHHIDHGVWGGASERERRRILRRRRTSHTVSVPRRVSVQSRRPRSRRPGRVTRSRRPRSAATGSRRSLAPAVRHQLLLGPWGRPRFSVFSLGHAHAPACEAGPMSGRIVECVVNVSEGRDEVALAEFAEAAGTSLLDVHRDPHHHRSVFTLAGQPELVAARARALATTVVARLNLRDHVGVHPRLGVLDVVPFVPYEPGGPPGRPLRSDGAA